MNNSIGDSVVGTGGVFPLGGLDTDFDHYFLFLSKKQDGSSLTLPNVSASPQPYSGLLSDSSLDLIINDGTGTSIYYRHKEQIEIKTGIWLNLILVGFNSPGNRDIQLVKSSNNFVGEIELTGITVTRVINYGLIYTNGSIVTRAADIITNSQGQLANGRYDSI